MFPRIIKSIFELYIHNKKHHIVLFYTSASFLSSIITMLAGVLTVRWLSPADIGLWQSVRLATIYAMFALVGINNGLSRELPYYMGQSNTLRSNQLLTTALSYVLSAGIAAILIGFGYLFFFRQSGWNLSAAIATVTIQITCTYYTNYLIVTFRSTKSFRDLAYVNLTVAIAGLLSIPLLYYFTYNGMLTRALLLAFLSLILMHIFRPFQVRPSWNKSAFVLLLKTGSPIFVLDYLMTAASTCDRLILLNVSGATQVGYFSIAVITREAICVIPGALSEYVYPRMSYVFGETGDFRKLWRMAVKCSILSFAAMLPLAIAGWYVLPYLISELFPKYIISTESCKIMMVAAVFSGAMVGRSAIWSAKRWRYMVVYQILCAFFTVIGPIIGVHHYQNSLEGVSIGYMCSQIAWLPIGWIIIYMATHAKTIINAA